MEKSLGNMVSLAHKKWFQLYRNVGFLTKKNADFTKKHGDFTQKKDLTSNSEG